MFGKSGFGMSANYTKVSSGLKYDNATRGEQFALVGLSDSANLVGFYENDKWSVRLAYNWRDKFLSGYGLDPYYINAYGQWDVSASWEFRKNFTVFFEGINVTNADRSGHMRNDQTVFFAAPGYARYAAGLRVNF